MSLRNRTPQRRPHHSAADSEALTAYLLNALEPEQQLAVQRHLQTCDICYLEYTNLAVLPSLLDTLSLDDIRELAAPEQPQSSAARAARPAKPRSTRRRASLLAGSAFSAAMAATGFVPAHASAAPPTSAHPGEETRPAADAAATAVELSVSALPLPGDETTTALDVEVRASRPLRQCTLHVITADGESIEACRWEGAPSTRVVFSGDIPLPASEIGGVEVLAADGTVLAARDLS